MVGYDGHDFYKHYMNGNRIYWRCQQRGMGCRARITTCCVDGYAMTNKPPGKILHNH